MQTDLGGLEHTLTLLVLGLGAAVLLLALVFMIVSLARLIGKPESVPLAAPLVPAVIAEPKAEEAPEPAMAAVAVVAAEEPEVVPKAKSELDHSEDIAEELLPVLIAAAATAIGKPVRVKDVVLVHTEKPNVWGTQGRIVIQRSHDTSSHQW